MPLAGHDASCRPHTETPFDFNPHAPCGARRRDLFAKGRFCISIHRLLAGHDLAIPAVAAEAEHISIHMPLAGHDRHHRHRPRHVLRISIHVPLAGHDHGYAILIPTT